MLIYILLSVRFMGDCNMIIVNEASSFKKFVSQILETWLALRAIVISFRYSVETLSNCLLDSENDLMIFFY